MSRTAMGLEKVRIANEVNFKARDMMCLGSVRSSIGRQLKLKSSPAHYSSSVASARPHRALDLWMEAAFISITCLVVVSDGYRVLRVWLSLPCKD